MRGLRNLKALPGRFTRSPFTRNVAVLASGTAMAQALTMLAYLVLVRLFDPGEFGLFAVFGSLTMTMMSIVSLRYELAIILARSEREAVNLLALTLLLVLLLSIAIGLLFILGGPWLLALFGAKDLAGLVWFLPPAAIVLGGNLAFGNWGNRGHDYKLLSVSQIWGSAGVAVAQILAGLMHFGVPGLILGQMVGMLMATLVLARQFAGRVQATLAMVSGGEMLRLAREHRDFPIYSMPTALLNSTTVTIPSVLLAALFSPTVAGLYWFSYRLMEMPITLIGQATRRVFYAEAAQRWRDGQPIMGLYAKASLALAGLAAPPALALVAFGMPLFAAAFGEEWREAGLYASWMAAWWLLRFASVPSAMLAPVLRLQRCFLAFSLVTFLPRLAVIPLAAMYADAVTAVAAYSAIGALYHLVSILIVGWHLRRRRTSRVLAPGE